MFDTLRDTPGVCTRCGMPLNGKGLCFNSACAECAKPATAHPLQNRHQMFASVGVDNIRFESIEQTKRLLWGVL